MPLREDSTATPPVSDSQREDFIAQHFPQLDKETIRQAVQLHNLIKAHPSPEFAPALNVLLGQDNTVGFEDALSKGAQNDTPGKRKVGRPISKVTSLQYMRNKFSGDYFGLVEHLFGFIESDEYDIAKRSIGYKRIPRLKENFNRPFASYLKSEAGKPNSDDLREISQPDFNMGAWWMITLMLNVHAPALREKMVELWSISKHVREQLKINAAKAEYLQQHVGFSAEMAKGFMRSRNKKLPKDIVMKVRDRKISKAKLLRFTRTVKELDKAFPARVAETMGVSLEDTMQIYEVSRERNMGISLENTPLGQIFMVFRIPREKST